MNRVIVSFYRDSDAIAGERKLLDAGMEARLVPAPAASGKNAGLCIAADSRDADRVKLILGETVRDMRHEDPGAGEAEQWAP